MTEITERNELWIILYKLNNINYIISQRSKLWIS